MQIVSHLRPLLILTEDLFEGLNHSLCLFGLVIFNERCLIIYLVLLLNARSTLAATLISLVVITTTA